MPDPAVPAPPPAASVSAIEREVRRHRIMERAQRGWSYELIAGAENLTPRRVGQIVGQTLALREVDPAGAPIRLPTARLDADRVEDGEPGAIDRLLRVLDRLDRCQTKAAALSLDEAAEGAAKSDAKPTISWRRPPRTRRAPPRAGGRTAARLAPLGRNARGAPSFNVEAPAEAVRAIAGSGPFGAPFAPVPTLAAAAAFERPESAGAASRKELPTRSQAVGIPYISCARHEPLPKLSKRLQNTFQELPDTSKGFQKFPKISGPRRRGGMAGRPSDGLGGASRLCRVRRESRLSKRARR